MNFYMITNCPEMATFAVASGVDRIFVDTEVMGKDERQGHLNTVISRHTLEDVRRLRPHVPEGRLLVRINPIHQGSQAEINEAIAAGADVLMLPMFSGVAEVQEFVSAVSGRARCSLLVETLSAVEHLEACVNTPGVDEVHIGLNDLHLEMGLNFMFELFASGFVDKLTAVLRASGVPYGIGGLARAGEGLLPAELLLAEHVRLGSSAAILSRTFHRQAKSVGEICEQMDFANEVQKLRDVYKYYSESDPATLTSAHIDVQRNVQTIVDSIKTRRPRAEK